MMQLKIFLLLLLQVWLATATHFRYGTISWVPRKGSTAGQDFKTIDFTVRLAFRRTFCYSDPSDGWKKNNKAWKPDPMPPSNIYTTDCIGNVVYNGQKYYINKAKDNTPLPSNGDIIWPGGDDKTGMFCYKSNNKDAVTSDCKVMYVTVDVYDAVYDWFRGSWAGSYTYTAGKYLAYYIDVARISSPNLVNNHDMSWMITTNVTVGTQVDAITTSGAVSTQYLSSPTSDMSPIVQVYKNYVNRVPVPAASNTLASGVSLSYYMSSSFYMGNVSWYTDGIQKQYKGWYSQQDIQSYIDTIYGYHIQPTGLSVTSTGTMIYDTTGNNVQCTADPCYYQTQITINDNQGTTTVVDFLLQLTTTSIVCSPTCTGQGNSGIAGQTCTKDEDCKNCVDTGVTGWRPCMPAQSLPYFIAPTPNPNSFVSFVAGQPGVVNITARTDVAGYSVSVLPQNSISTSFSSSLWTAQTGLNPGWMLLKWTPTMNDIGSYPIVISVRDSNGNTMLGQQQSFTIQVIYPVCGFGTLNTQTGKCVCQTGFDASTNCQTCVPGYYGNGCTVCPNCNNGTCADGTSGTGQCICNSGYTGERCDTPSYQACTSHKDSYPVTTVYGNGVVKPNFVGLYISSNQSITQVTIPVVTALPNPVQSLDVLIIIDQGFASYTTTTSTYFTAATLSTFATNIATKVSSNVFFGLASFINNGAYPNVKGSNNQIWNLRAQLSPAADLTSMNTGLSALASQIQAFPSGAAVPAASYPSNANIACQLDAVNQAASTSAYNTQPAVGWRAGAFRVALVLTNSGFQDAANVGATRAALKAQLIANNIVPVFYVDTKHITDAGNPYPQLINDLSFGVAAKSAVNYADWTSGAVTAISQAVTQVSVVVKKDDFGFANTLPASQTVALGKTATSNVQFGYPLGYSQPFEYQPTVIIQVMGYGVSTYQIQINRPPIVNPATVSTQRGNGVAILPAAVDPDLNLMVITFITLPANGVLYQTQDMLATYAIGQWYKLPGGFDGTPAAWYKPNDAFYGSDNFVYRVYDGCLNSTGTAVHTIQVTYVPGTPNCASPVNAVIQQNSELSLTLGAVDDVDDASSAITVFIIDLPNTGSLLQSGSRAAIGANTAINNQALLYVPPTNFFTADDTSISFTYQAQNTHGVRSTICKVAVTVTHVNQPPVASADSVTVTRSVASPITVKSTDVDLVDTATYYLLAYTGPSGTFTYGNNIVAPPSSSLGTGVAVSGAVQTNGNNKGSAQFTLYYTAPNTASGSNYATATFKAVDAGGLPSNIVNITIGVVDAKKPTAVCPSPAVTLSQGTSPSSAFKLTGTSPDVADNGYLGFILTTAPKNGKLYRTDTNAAITDGTTISYAAFNAMTFTYKPNSNAFYGPDSYTFKVTGYTSATSDAVTCGVTVTHVNTAPTASFASASTNENKAVLLTTQIFGSDFDTASYGDVITAYVTDLPNFGVLNKYNAATPNTPGAAITACSKGSQTSACTLTGQATSSGSGSNFYVWYTPNLNFYNVDFDGKSVAGKDETVSIFVQDNYNPAGQSAIVTGTITVNEVDVNPLAKDVSVTVNEYNGLSSGGSQTFLVTLVGQAFNPNMNTFSAYLTSLPSSNLIVSTADNSNNKVLAKSTSTGLVLKLTLKIYQFGTATFTYRVNDGRVDSSNEATVTINVIFVNVPPACSTLPGQNVIAAYTGTTALTLQITDPDAAQKFSFNIKNYQQGAGSASLKTSAATGSQAVTTSAPTKIDNLSATNTRVTLGLVFTPPAVSTQTQTNYATFDFDVSDGNTTATCQVKITLQAVTPPVALPAGPLTLRECSATECAYSQTLTLKGYSVEQSNSTIAAIITSLPAHGTLFLNDTTAAATGVQILNKGNQVYFVPNAYYSGSDSFQFLVVDALGISSTNTITVGITVNPVNFPPKAVFNPPLVTPENKAIVINGQKANLAGFNDQGQSDSTLKCWIKTVSQKGKYYQYSAAATGTDGVANAGAAINVASGSVQITDSQYRVVFMPDTDTYGANYAQFDFFFTNNGAENFTSNTASGSIDVTFVPKNPLPQNKAVTVAQNYAQLLPVTVTVNDPQADTKIVIALTGLTNSSLVTIVNGTGSPIAAGTPIDATGGSATVYLAVTPGAFHFGTTTFTFSAKNTWLNSLADGVVTVTVTPIPLAPVAFANSPLTATRSVPLTIYINGSDIQPPAVFDFVIDTATANGGVFSFSSAPKTVATGVNTDANGNAFTTLTYTAPATAAGNNFAKFTFHIEYAGLSSNKVTVSINIAPDTLPIAITKSADLFEDGKSDPITLGGSDVDIADQGHLTAKITSLPSDGLLYVNGDTLVLVTVGTEFPLTASFIYVPTPLIGTTEGFYGVDYFHYYVTDLVGGNSQPVNVTLNVEHVNHQPSGSCQPVTGIENQQSTFTVQWADVDRDTVASDVTLWITAVPDTTYGSLKDVSGNVITPTTPVKVANWSVTFVAAQDWFGTLGSFTFYVDDGAKANNSKSALVTVPIVFTQVAVAPVPQPVNATTNQDIAVTVDLPATDADSPVATININTLPEYGTLTRADKTEVTSSNPTVSCTLPTVTAADLSGPVKATPYSASGCTVTYTPTQGWSGEDSFKYSATDSTGQVSAGSSDAHITVIANRPPPIVVPNYPVTDDNTTQIVTLYENGVSVFNVQGMSVDPNLDQYENITLNIKDTVTKGSLVFYQTSATGQLTLVPVTGAVTLKHLATNFYQFKFTPLINEFGSDYARFHFYVSDPNGNSITWTIIFNVIHVPQAPYITPLTYQVIDASGKPAGTKFTPNVNGKWTGKASAPVVGVENLNVVVTWNATSIDVETGVVSWASLSTNMVSIPSKGTFYPGTLNKDGTVTVGTKAITSATPVPRDTDGLWRVVFVPIAWTSGLVYSSFTLRADDIPQSTAATAVSSGLVISPIRIKAVPRPPTIAWGIEGDVNNHTVITLDTTSVVVNASLTAVDAGYENLLLVVLIARDDGAPLANNESLALHSTNAEQLKRACSGDQTNVTCSANKVALNNFLSQVSFSNLQNGVLYDIVAYVNTVGAGADAAERDLYHQEAEDVAGLKVNIPAGVEAGAATGGAPLTPIIAGAAGAGAAAAAIAYRFLSKRKPPITGFFGEETMASDAIQDNPLYEDAGDKHFTNPLYGEEI